MVDSIPGRRGRGRGEESRGGGGKWRRGRKILLVCLKKSTAGRKNRRTSSCKSQTQNLCGLVMVGMSCTCSEIRKEEANSFVACWSRGHCKSCVVKIEQRSPPRCPMCYNFANKRGDVCRSCFRRARRYVITVLQEYEVEIKAWDAWAQENYWSDPHGYAYGNPRPSPPYAVPHTRADAHAILLECQ